MGKVAAGHDHLYEAQAHARKFFCGLQFDLKEPLLLVGYQGARHPSEFRRLGTAIAFGLATFRDQHIKLQEGVAECFIDKLEHDLAGHDEAAQIDDKPPLRRQVDTWVECVRFPIGLHIAVKEVQYAPCVGAGADSIAEFDIGRVFFDVIGRIQAQEFAGILHGIDIFAQPPWSDFTVSPDV